MSGPKPAYGALLAALIAVSAHAQTPALPGYGITLIPAPSGSAGITPTAINTSGQVTGSIAFFAGQPAHAFIWSSGTLTDIGTLPYPGSASYGSATGQSISDAGVIVGTIIDPGTPPMWSFGFLYNDNAVLALLNNPTGFPFCTATGVNSSTLIVGNCSNVTESIAAIYVNGTAQQFGPAGASANAVNDLGQIAASGTPAFIYSSAGGTLSNIPQLSGGSSSTQMSATSINNAGQAVGWQLNNTSYLSFFYSNGSSVALSGVPASTVAPGVAINNAGQIVGYTVTKAAATPVPFYFAHGLSTNLNTLVSVTDPNKRFVTLTNAWAISDSGAIVASGTDSRTPGVPQAYVLTPTTAFSSMVELNTSVSSVVAGTAFTLFWTAQNLTACSASGGSGNDGWKGAVAFNGGQQQVTETAAGTYDFTISCSDSNSGAMEDSQVSVTVTAKPAPPHNGGGGTLDLGTLLGLLLLCAARRWRSPARRAR
jgi:probable HAF family extracellular repeat protein